MKTLSARQKTLLLMILASLAIKFALFTYASINVPSSKFMPDTPTYLEPGINLIERGVFATIDDSGNIKYDHCRTPGYPIFVAFLNRVLGLSYEGIIIVQILLVTFAGYLVYKTAYSQNKDIAILASFIFLFDQPTTISTLMILTEALYAFFMAVFIHLFLQYLRGYKIGMLLLSVSVLIVATYIRPISYYLGLFIGGYVFCVLFRKKILKAVTHLLIFILIFYSSMGLWQYRNYIRTGRFDFTTVDNVDLSNMGLIHKYVRKGGYAEIKMNPVVYYVDNAARSAIEFFTLPGTLKYLKSRPLRIASKIYGYPWMVFWLIGLFFARFDKLEYRFLLYMILYFMVVSVVVIGLSIGSRFRVPVMPLISILSASGWVRIVAYLKYKGGP